MKFDIHYLFSAKYAKWIIISLISLFSLLIAYEYLSLFFSFPTSSPSQNTDNKPVVTIKQDSTDYILTSSLFGVYVPDNLKEENVKQSTLNVNLAGIMLADKIEDSQVILRSSSGEEKTYNVGDKIPGGAVIKRIMAGGILVEHNGALESLSFPKNDLTFEPVAKPLKEE